MNLDKYMEILLRLWDTDEQTVDKERATKIVLIESDNENEVGHHPLSYPEPMATLMIQHFNLLSAADQLTLRNCEGGLVIWDTDEMLEVEYKLFETHKEADRLYCDLSYDANRKAGKN